MQKSHLLTLIFITMLWGLNCVLSKIGMEDFPPLLYSALRFTLIVPALFFVPKPDVPWRYIIALALFWGVIQFACLNFAISMGISVSLCTLLFQSSTFFAMLFSSWLLKEEPTFFQMIGLVIGIIGIALMSWDADKSATLIGFILALTAAASWGLGNVLMKKAATEQSFSLLAWTSALPAFPLLLLSLMAEGQEIKSLFNDALPLKGIGCALYSSLIAVLIGGSLWMRLLRAHSVNQIAGFGLLVPLFAIFFSRFILGESLTLYNLMAGGFIVMGLLVSQIVPKTQLRIRLEAFVNDKGKLEIKLCRS